MRGAERRRQSVLLLGCRLDVICGVRAISACCACIPIGAAARCRTDHHVAEVADMKGGIRVGRRVLDNHLDKVEH